MKFEFKKNCLFGDDSQKATQFSVIFMKQLFHLFQHRKPKAQFLKELEKYNKEREEKMTKQSGWGKAKKYKNWPESFWTIFSPTSSLSANGPWSLFTLVSSFWCQGTLELFLNSEL